MGKKVRDGASEVKDAKKERRRRTEPEFRVADDAESQRALVLPLGLGLAAVVFAIYLQTAYPTVPGGDAAELVFLSCSLGIAHPPGYPLFIMLGHLFYRFLPFGTPGFRVNCVSCLCGAVATFLLFTFCQRWYCSRGYRASSGWAFLVAGSWALSPLVWQYHTQAEVFSLNNVIAALHFLLAQLHHEACAPLSGTEEADRQRQRARTWCCLGALSVGVGLSNQHAIIFYSLPVILTVYLRDACVHGNVLEGPFFAKLCACGLVGLTPYLFLVWSASRNDLAQLGSWGDQRTLSGFLTHFLRTEYGTFKLYSGKDAKYTSIFKWMHLYTCNVSDNFLVVGTVLLPAGLIATLQYALKESTGGLVAGAFLFYWIAFHNLANLPADDQVMPKPQTPNPKP